MTVAEQAAETTVQQPVHTRALIIGTGFSGLGMAIELQRRNVDFLILEKADEIGGTWRDNTYPGCACDIPSHMYSFSFEPKPDWKHMWSFQPEIFDYLKGVTDKYGLRRYIRFDSRVDRAHWDDDEMRWHVFTDDGREFVAQFLVSGVGGLHIPLVPEFEGIDEFAGAAFHSAQWDHTVDLTGKRVAVIGTGASAIQIVPEIVKDVAALQLYQRTPAWVMPRPNNPIPQWMRTAFTNVPGTRALMRAGIYWIHEAVGFAMTQQPRLLKIGELLGKWNIRRAVKDRELRRKLTPNYRAGCKRILNSDTYYQGIANPKTEVITDGIARFTPNGIVTRRRHRTRRRRRGVRHRLPRHRLVHLRRHQGSRRRGPGGPVEPRGRGRPPRHRGRRYAEPVLPARAEHRAGAQLRGVHDRVADPVRGAGDRRGGQGRSGRRWRRRASHRTATTPSCRTSWRARCGTPEVAGAGTWTSTA